MQLTLATHRFSLADRRWLQLSHGLLPFYLTLPHPRIPWNLLSHRCLGFLLISILIRCPNRLSSHLSTISVTGTSFPKFSYFLFCLFLFVCSTSSLRQQSYFHILLILSNFLSHTAALQYKPFYKLPFYCYSWFASSKLSITSVISSKCLKSLHHLSSTTKFHCMLQTIHALRKMEITGITVGSVENNNSFFQFRLNNMFFPSGASSGWQEWTIKYAV